MKVKDDYLKIILSLKKKTITVWVTWHIANSMSIENILSEDLQFLKLAGYAGYAGMEGTWQHCAADELNAKCYCIWH